MPIDYKEYHPKWTLIVRLILKRAKNRCEDCGLLNHSIIRKRDRKTPGGQEWDMFHAIKKYRKFTNAMAMRSMNFTKVILTTAHLDHDKKNNRFWNLKSLCQKCHLNHDITHHTYSRKYGRNAKNSTLKLF